MWGTVSAWILALPKPFWGLLMLCALDYAAGVASAIVHKKLSSKIGAVGIAKKIGILSVVAVAHIVDLYVIGTGTVCGHIAIIFYIVNESISIMENYAELGLPMPKKLTDVLAQFKENKGDQ